ncbi:MAG: hypothetical protein FJZ78_11560 [Bacteroidetes bacterium]|nr:hypothetical protein [Bacteroidota bacterium]
MEKCALQGDTSKKNWYENQFKLLDAKIRKLKLPKPALRTLIDAGIYSVKDLENRTPTHLGNQHGMGPASLKKLKRFFK